MIRIVANVFMILMVAVFVYLVTHFEGASLQEKLLNFIWAAIIIQLCFIVAVGMR